MMFILQPNIQNNAVCIHNIMGAYKMSL